MTVEELLALARSKFRRLDPREADAARRANGAVIVDIRSDAQRASDGIVPARNTFRAMCSSGAVTRLALGVTRP